MAIFIKWNINDSNIWVFIVLIKEKCVESFPSHLQFSLQSETDFPEIPSEFRISWNCLSLSDHTTLMWRSCIHPEISDVSDFSWIKCLWMEPSSKVRSISDSKWELWSLSFSVFRAELRLYPTNHIKPSLMHSQLRDAAVKKITGFWRIGF